MREKGKMAKGGNGTEEKRRASSFFPFTLFAISLVKPVGQAAPAIVGKTHILVHFSLGQESIFEDQRASAAALAWGEKS